MSEITARPFDFLNAGYAEKLKTSLVSGTKVDLDEDPNKPKDSFEDILNKALTAVLQSSDTDKDTKVAPVSDVSASQGPAPSASGSNQTTVSVAETRKVEKAADSGVVANKVSPHQWGAQG